METAIKEVTEQMEHSATNMDDVSTMTKQAVRIAEIALTCFKDELLDRALGISKAIVAFENEMRCPTEL